MSKPKASNSALLKEAIADANAVRTLALDNAKRTLLEAFTPKIQSMLSTKIREEEETEETEEAPAEQAPAEEAPAEEAPVAEEAPAEQAPAEEEPTEESMNMDNEEDLDLEAVIRELQDEAAPEEQQMESVDNQHSDYTEIEEVINALREEESTETSEEKPEEETSDAESQLAEAMKVIQILKSRLNEVNMVNAKLLYAMNIFKAHQNLSEAQKMAIVDQFDRASNIREVKLVYATLAESFKNVSTRLTVTAKTPVKEAAASKPVNNTTRITTETKPAIIAEDAVAARFRKLAKLKG